MTENNQDEYTDEIDQGDIDSLITKVNNAEAKESQYIQTISGLQSEHKENNFLHHQIGTEELIEKLEHFYSGDYQGYDSDKNWGWIKQKNNKLKTFNKYGVTSLMEIITKYIDKNTILSDYTEQRIYEIMGDIGDELILFMLCNYNKMGMDTHFKKTKFRLMITTTTHLIESAYNRAKGGKTLIELNQTKVLGQFGDSNPLPRGKPKREGFFNRVFN